MQNEGIGPFTGAFSHAIIDGMVDDGSVLAVMRQVWGLERDYGMLADDGVISSWERTFSCSILM